MLDKWVSEGMHLSDPFLPSSSLLVEALEGCAGPPFCPDELVETLQVDYRSLPPILLLHQENLGNKAVC